MGVGRSLDVVTQCEIQQSFSAIRKDLQRLARATYFCELLDRFTGDRDEASSQELFDLTIGALLLLQRAGAYCDAVVHAYELQLLSALGYAPVLDRCVACGAAPNSRGAGSSPALGGIVCAADRYRTNDAVPLSRSPWSCSASSRPASRQRSSPSTLPKRQPPKPRRRCAGLSAFGRTAT